MRLPLPPSRRVSAPILCGSSLSSPRLFPWLGACLLSLPAIGAPQLPPSSTSVAARVPLPKTELVGHAGDPLVPQVAQERLVVKFGDSWKARAASDGTLSSLTGSSLDDAQQIAASAGFGFKPLIGLDSSRIQALEERAATRSGRAQPDLLGMMVLDGPSSTSSELVALGNRLLALSCVEFVSLTQPLAPPPGDLAPPTPDFSVNQANYVGLEVGHGFDAVPDVAVEPVRVSVCEYGWIYGHEDLVDVDLHPEPGQTPDPFVEANDFDDHGTAGIGILAAVSNGFGCTGVAGGAEFYTYPEFTLEGGLRRVECIAAAISDSKPGDIVLLEMQTSAGFVLNFVPAEFDPAVFTVVKVGTDAGVCVVAPAGNGSQDLDSPTFDAYNAMGDSGAILVGAGSADNSHSMLPFSTFGSRVDVQSFGQNVFTLGFGDFAQFGGEPEQAYTANFNGTSSAAALITGVCIRLQAHSIELFGQRLTPKQMRQVLLDGSESGQIEPLPLDPMASPPGPVVPFPRLPLAIASLPDSPWADLGSGLPGTFGVPQLTAQGPGEPGSSYAILVENARPSSPMVLAAGTSSLGLGLFGGTLVPTPDLLSFGLATDDQGEFSLISGLGPNAMPGFEILLQFWVLDPLGPEGWSATNSLMLEVQPPS